MKSPKSIFGFTLVELIVVITIVGILSTVGFVSYSGYLAGARDSNRFSQLTKLSDSLQVYAATKSLPLPDDYIEVTASGAVIGYQGYVGVDVLETIDYTNGGKDPKDGSYYTYYLTKDRNSMQLLAMMEEQSSVSFSTQSYAADYTERVPKVYGKKLGVLTESISNTPIQEVSGLTGLDIVSTTDSYIAHISDSIKLEGLGTVLQASIPNGNCKRLKQTGKSKGNGTYTINPRGTGDISIYCFMEGGESVADMLDGEGDFSNGVGISTEGGSNITNTIVEINSPISSGYAVHQTTPNTSEYEIHLKDVSKCKGGDVINLQLWSTDTDTNEAFQFRVTYVDSSILSPDFSNVKTLAERNIGGKLWTLKSLEIPTNGTKEISNFGWYIGWSNSPGADLDWYFTGVRLACY